MVSQFNPVWLEGKSAYSFWQSQCDHCKASNWQLAMWSQQPQGDSQQWGQVIMVWWHSYFASLPTSLSVPVTFFASGLCRAAPGAKWFKTTATLPSQVQTDGFCFNSLLVQKSWIWQICTPATWSCNYGHLLWPVPWPFILEHKEKVCSQSFQQLKWQAEAYTAGCFLCHDYSVLTCFL